MLIAKQGGLLAIAYIILIVQIMLLFLGSTLKQGCTAGIKLILSEDGQYLEVTEVIGEHNHAVHQVRASLMCVLCFGYTICDTMFARVC